MYPFTDRDLFSTLQEIIAEINSLENDYVLNASQSELEKLYVGKSQIDPLILHKDDIYIKNKAGILIDVSHDPTRMPLPGKRAVVPGTSIEIAIPFAGDRRLWYIRPSKLKSRGYPEIHIDDNKNEIVFSVQFPADSPDKTHLKTEIDSKVEALSDAVDCLSKDINKHNNSACEKITQVLESKKTQAQNSIDAINSLGIPVKKSNSEPK